MSATAASEPHWLIKGTGDAVHCLCILELPNGEYWVVGSPTGTYLSGHADRGHWRRAEAEYLAQGYLREADAKAQGLVPPAWSGGVPDPKRLLYPPWRRARFVLLMVALLTATGVALVMVAR
ncbi:MAG TPA: hypothetical protein VFO85_08765 [Vicinamibacteria bacterium]|nr:hypothetical protein [Vicinamibacteria bacterium]